MDKIIGCDCGHVIHGETDHELATNAAKYGALSSAEGQVFIEWRLVTPEVAEVHWREAGGPPVEAPVRRGFGTTVVERLVRKSLDAEVTLDFNPDGLHWTLDCPASVAIDAYDTKRPPD